MKLTSFLTLSRLKFTSFHVFTFLSVPFLQNTSANFLSIKDLPIFPRMVIQNALKDRAEIRRRSCDDAAERIRKEKSCLQKLRHSTLFPYIIIFVCNQLVDTKNAMYKNIYVSLSRMWNSILYDLSCYSRYLRFF